MDKLILLDLEDALITPLAFSDLNTMKPGLYFYRNGLVDFMKWLLGGYKVQIFTSVPEPMVRNILKDFIRDRIVKRWFYDVVVHVAMDSEGNTLPPPEGVPDRRVKDLLRLTDNPNRLVMIDDNPEAYCVPGQESSWLKIPPISGKNDRELWNIRPAIDIAAAGGSIVQYVTKEDAEAVLNAHGGAIKG